MATSIAVTGPVRSFRTKAALWLLGLSLSRCTFSWEPSFDEDVDPAELESVEIASPDEALTFARYKEAGVLRLMRVDRYEDGMVHGIDLSAALEQEVTDPIPLFHALGFDEIALLAASAKNTVSRSVDELVIPLELRDHHIAAGVNYAEHAGEAGVEEDPYLFPKLVAPTPWNAEVSVHKGLLDYEVELAFVTLSPVTPETAPESMGLLLCSDYTDRETLLRNLDVDDVTSGDGFTTGKSFPGYLPVGNLFVIPKDYRSFAADITLKLYVNYALRQRESVSAAVWDIDELFKQIWARRGVTWEHRGKRVSLFSDTADVIEDRVLIMSGTPYGVVFNEVGGEQKATGFFDWLFGGWGESIPDHAIEDYITDARAAGIYLLTGDKVDIHVERMGVVRNEVVE